MKHALQRTSPKGTPFYGVCTLCGESMSLKDAFKTECSNVRGLSENGKLLEAIKPTYN